MLAGEKINTLNTRREIHKILRTLAKYVGTKFNVLYYHDNFSLSNIKLDDLQTVWYSYAKLRVKKNHLVLDSINIVF